MTIFTVSFIWMMVTLSASLLFLRDQWTRHRRSGRKAALNRYIVLGVLVGMTPGLMAIWVAFAKGAGIYAATQHDVTYTIWKNIVILCAQAIGAWWAVLKCASLKSPLPLTVFGWSFAGPLATFCISLLCSLVMAGLIIAFGPLAE